MTLLWKTESNRSISIIEDRISELLHYYYKACYEKGSYHRRWACIVDIGKAVLLWRYIFWIGGLDI